MKRRQQAGIALLSLAVAWGAPAPAQPEAPGPTVYVIPIHDEIEPALLYVIRRGLAEASRETAAAIVFSMDTPGGRLSACEEIVDLIQKVQVPTYTFVEKNAVSAGAIIALATKGIYLAPGSSIGDAMPILALPGTGPQELPENLQEKIVSPTAAIARSAAQQSGHNPDVAEAMVRRDVELKIGDEVIKEKGRLLTLTNVEAERRYGTNSVPLLSAGTVRDIPEMLDRLNLRDARIREMRVTSAERIARWIQMLGALFLIGGALGIWIEIKTPGFGLPGILGITCLAIFFWGHHIAGLAGFEDLLLFTLGLTLLLVEVFVTPGFGVLGVLGLLLMVAGLLMAMVYRLPDGPLLPALPQLRIPMLTVSAAAAGTTLVGLLIARYLPRTPLFRSLTLDFATAAAAGYTAAASRTELAGAVGEAVTDLRPAGTAVFGGRRIDVVTTGGFVARGTAVRVTETQGSRTVVEAVGEKGNG